MDDEQFHASEDEEALPTMQLKNLLPSGIDWVRHTRIIMTLVSIVVLLVMAGIVLGIYVWDYGLIADGVFLNGVDIGHLSPQAAEEKIGKELNQYLSQPVEFTFNNEKRFITLATLGYSYDLKSALSGAYAIGRKGGLFEKVLDKMKASRGLKLEAAGRWNETTLEQTLKTVFTPLTQAPIDASFRLEESESILISPETPGKEIDLTALIPAVKSLDPTHLHPIQPAWHTIQPAVTAAQLEKSKPTKLLSTYSTQFNLQQANRSHNILLAAQTIDNTLLRPGEEFSFNERVGERTTSAGYLEAPIIVDKAVVPGTGGGVCQVSSTLYNAALNAGLNITERHPHALPVAYVPPGRDATVSYGTLDFKFRNISSGFLRIHSEVNGGTVTFSLYGPPDA
ncbi:MAG: VanW family protein [Desulfitobacteriaceae bacterium]|nr:VanW family protein [Desulfitobacteriaceae bacterium]MDI6916134.1 VanW family protein [Desulfitobacteriaceae bacterium]